jgi:hypothetical protein
MGHREEQIDAMKTAHPLDAQLFGAIGAYAAKLCVDVSQDLLGRQYEFMEMGNFNAIGDATRRNQVYWREMLFRVHWAAALNLMRHQRWQAGCTAAFKAPANLLSFAVNLRGMIESSLDANYSLGPVPKTLADNHSMVEASLKGTLDGALVTQEMEDRLIHFVYGRKVAKTEKGMLPTSHVALEPKEYRSAIGLPETERQSFTDLYDHLCGLCHPTAFSLVFLWNQTTREDATIVNISEGQDDARIEELVQKFEKTIQFAISLSVTASALCLKTINWFSLPEVRCPSIERWTFDDVPAWRKAWAALSNGSAV